ncbi:c-type cytochrome [Prosthecomicrobium sp. N25]|uniref:c-type cytochrome n=1 Tax=Prosthecomicrobium sp. N25 TaxID=3129254 RepID=UPI0030768DFA
MGRNGLAGLAATALLLLGGSCAVAADVANGERLARRWCAECHVVAPDQKTASADVPGFSAIAAKPERTPENLTSLLTSPDKAHSRMQDLNLARTEIADLVAYIRAQK